MYGTLVIAYLFLGGAAAGALFAMSAWSLWLRVARTRTPQSQLLVHAFAALRKRVYVVGFMMLALAMVCLLWDLGTPERALLLFLRPHPTVLTFGAYTLAVEGVLAALLAASHLFGHPILGKCALFAAEILCCAGAVATMVYTGVFLLNSGIAFWNTEALVGLFVLSSLSAGISTLLLIDWFIQGQTMSLCAAKPLQKWHLACLAFETVFLTLFVCAAFSNPGADAARAVLLSPDMLATAVLGIGMFGIALPAILEIYSVTRKYCRTIPVADAACLLGCLILRYVVIACAMR